MAPDSDMTPKKRVRSRERKMDYDHIPEEYAILTTDSNKYLKIVVIVVALSIVLFAAYYMTRNLVSPQPKVFVKLYDKITFDYRPANAKSINEALAKETRVPLMVKVLAKPNPYKNVYGEQAFRDYALVTFINQYNQEVGKVFIKMTKTSGGYYEGISNYYLTKQADRDNFISGDVMIMLTNKQRAADMIPVRVPLSEQ
ncbi:MAG: hypothetical protein LWY06_15450 [Firmicutes bacterium]|nr:hypothetical protein [Bacillota bacterium]